ncbi:MAG TPA: CHAD domain-containing protein [Verrucomicrobiota bacterium]|nr:CHAD domain-containing protein [Verrucomicrobiota bacterium]
MKRGQRRKTSSTATPDVLKHLADSLDTGWNRYRKRLKQCQEGFSEAAVHQSRVETRRLLSTIELLGAFLPEAGIEKARVSLKAHLDTFDKLRDTQVQLIYVGHLTEKFPAAREFHEWLVRREDRFLRATRKAVKRIKTGRTGRRIRVFHKAVKHRRKQMTPEAAFKAVGTSVDRAFKRVATLCGKVRGEDTETIHRTRIAFKRFRYMAEALSPLLPALTDEHRRAMRGYQSLMGDIQDVEVLIATFGKFRRKENVTGRAVCKLEEELHKRRQWLIRVYLYAAGKLGQFWPPRPFAPQKQSEKPKPQKT